MGNVSELVSFLSTTNKIKGVSMVSIKGYTNKHGEVANHVVNLGASLGNAKKKDLEELKKVDVYRLWLQYQTQFDLELFYKGYINVYDSLVPIGGEKYDGTIKEKSKRSTSQTNAYTVFNSSIKVHNEKERLYVYGLRIKKEVITKGVYPIVKSRPLTKIQNIFKQGMKHTKFVMYIIEKSDVINISKTQFKGSQLRIKL